MIKYLFNKHKTYKWYKNSSVFMRGMYFDDNGFHESENLLSIRNCSNEEEFVETIKKMNGNFSIINDTKEKVLFAVDRISTLPLFYSQHNGSIYISDSAKMIQNELLLDKVSINNTKEFLATGYVTGNKTLFDEIKILQAGQYAVIDKSTMEISVKNYFLHVHKNTVSYTPEQLCKKLDSVVINVFKRVINSLNNRTVVLFLSGGYDSRLVAVNLKRLNYRNVICVSFGNEKFKDVACAKKIAHELGYPLLRINTSKRWFKQFKEKDEFKMGTAENSYGFAMNYPQGLYICELMKEGLIPKDAIVITGNSGDVVEGDDVCTAFRQGELYTDKQVIDEIINQHYSLQGKKFQDQDCFYRFVKEVIGYKSKYDYEEAQDAYEFFNWRARQAKYVVNDVTNYNDILGLDWRLPLWDNEFVDFWLNVPMELRYKRKLYYQYVEKEIYPTANNLTLKRHLINLAKQHFPKLIEKTYYFSKYYSFVFSSKVDPLGIYGIINLREFSNIMRYTRGYRTEWRTCYVRNVYKNEYKKFSNDINLLT